MNLETLQPWESLMKQIVWRQIMIDIEMWVSDIETYKKIAFFII